MVQKANPMADALREHDYFHAGEIAAGEIMRLEDEILRLKEEAHRLHKLLENNHEKIPSNQHLEINPTTPSIL